MWKRFISICVLMFCVTACLAQSGTITPYQKSVLDRWYFQTNSSIDGALIIDGTITTGKLAFAVVPYEDWTNHLVIFFLHTNNDSAHHTRFDNSEETDQVFTQWVNQVYPSNAFAELKGGSVPFLLATNLNVVNGTIAAGNLQSTWFEDGDILHIEESGQYSIQCTFSNVLGHPAYVKLVGHYDGNPAHNVKMQVWDVTTDAWSNITAAANDFASGSSDLEYIFDFSRLEHTNLVANNMSTVRVTHLSAAVGSHDFYIDQMELTYAQLDMPAPGTFYDVTNFSLGLFSNVTVDAANGRFVPEIASTYSITCGGSGTGSSNTIYHARLLTNGVASDIEFYRKIGSLGDVGNAWMNGYMYLTPTMTLSVQISSTKTNSFASFANFDFNMKRIGN